MIGLKFGRLTVLEMVGRYKNGDAKYRCICDCGKERVVLSGNLKKGNTKSCGCLHKEASAKFWGAFNLRHGKTKTKLWKTWSGILDRTTCKNHHAYARYGGAGIGIFEDWKIFENFAAYIGEPPSDTHSVDRIDNSKGYEPENVRWATKKEQAENRRATIFVNVDGKRVCLSDAAKMLNISKSTASRWFKAGKLK
jgi:hypothetical protein